MKTNPDIRTRTRAAGCYLEMTRSRETGRVAKDAELAAFMAIFHPEVKGKHLRRLLKT